MHLFLFLSLEWEREQDSGWTRLNSKFNHGALNNELRHGTGSPTCWTDSPIFILIKRCVERCCLFFFYHKTRGDCHFPQWNRVTPVVHAFVNEKVIKVRTWLIKIVVYPSFPNSVALNLYSVSSLQINNQNVDNFSVHETYAYLINRFKERSCIVDDQTQQ